MELVAPGPPSGGWLQPLAGDPRVDRHARHQSVLARREDVECLDRIALRQQSFELEAFPYPSVVSVFGQISPCLYARDEQSTLIDEASSVEHVLIQCIKGLFCL